MSAPLYMSIYETSDWGEDSVMSLQNPTPCIDSKQCPTGQACDTCLNVCVPKDLLGASACVSSYPNESGMGGKKQESDSGIAQYKCGPLSKWSADSRECECIDNAELKTDNSCGCISGYHYDKKSKTCAKSAGPKPPPVPPVTCPSLMKRNPNDTCGCVDNAVPTHNGLLGCQCRSGYHADFGKNSCVKNRHHHKDVAGRSLLRLPDQSYLTRGSGNQKKWIPFALISTAATVLALIVLLRGQ